jgi:hypothetical protein
MRRPSRTRGPRRGDPRTPEERRYDFWRGSAGFPFSGVILVVLGVLLAMLVLIGFLVGAW